MKKHHHAIRTMLRMILFSLLMGSSLLVFPQASTIDSLNYELQRQKVNTLLDQRQDRFGQYENSLKSRSGIFGLKTKRDMQSSIDILLQIVEMDTEVFLETRKLLTFKDQMLEYSEFEKEKIQGLTSEYDQRINGYISTISKVQQEQDRLRAEINALRSKNANANVFIFLALIILIGTGVVLWYRKKKKNGESAVK